MDESFGLRDLAALPWWILLFWGLGILAVSTAIVSLFFALGRRPGKAWASEVPPVASRDFLVGHLRAGELAPRGRRHREAPEQRRRDSSPPSSRRCARRARRSTSPSTSGSRARSSDMVLEVITERARAGVEVRVLLDGLGGMRAPSEGFDALKAAGGRVQRFRPVRLGGLTRFHRRNHRRSIVIDGVDRLYRGRGGGGQVAGERRQQGGMAGQHGAGDGPAGQERPVGLHHDLGGVRGRDADGRRALPRPRGLAPRRAGGLVPHERDQRAVPRGPSAAAVLHVVVPVRASHALHHDAVLRARRADAGRGGRARPAGRGRAHPRCPTS